MILRLSSLFQPKTILAPNALKHPDLTKTTSPDIERTFARLFSSDDGKAVLSHLQVMTFSRAYGPDASDQSLRYAEGQRALVAHILRMIDRGRS